MRFPDILTPRLRLICLDPSLMQADLTRNTARFANLLHAEVPDSWPPEHWEPHCFDFIERLHAERPYAIPWSRYVALRGSPDVLIGCRIGRVEGPPPRRRRL